MQISGKTSGAEEALALLEFVGGNAARAQRMAINESLAKVRTDASKEIRKQVKLTRKYVNDNLRIAKAVDKRLVGHLRTKKSGILLSRFSTDASVRGAKVSLLRAPKAPKRGIRVEVEPGSRKVVGTKPGNASKSFYVILPSSRTVAIAQRTAGGKLDVLHGPSLSQVFTDVKDEVNAGEIYRDSLLRKINFLLRQKYPTENA